MLSSAHVLAMDAKNLLDVVDNIRMSYSTVDNLILRGRSVPAHSGSPARTRSAASGSASSGSASSSAASSLEKHRDSLSPLTGSPAHRQHGLGTVS